MDLLKYNKHKNMSDFIDTVFSLSFLPFMNRPTRITDSSATIIDNIFTNCHDAGVIGSDVPWLECPACNALTWVITVTE